MAEGNQRSKSRFNPRGGDRRGQRQIGARPTSSLWYGLALLLVLGLAQMYYLMPAGRSLPYSEFKALLKSGQVAEVVLGDQLIRGTLKEGRREAAEFHGHPRRRPEAHGGARDARRQVHRRDGEPVAP